MRGFDGEQTLYAENGIIIRNELSVAIPDCVWSLILDWIWDMFGGPSDEISAWGKIWQEPFFGIRGNFA